MDNRTDENLVREAQAGHGEAFADLVRRYQDHAYGTAVAMLSDFDLARDVVQESFLAAYRDLGGLREPAKFGGWLHAIVRNMARRAVRELARVRAMTEAHGGEVEMPDPAPRPDESAMDTERRQIVRRALARLGEPNREAVSLFYVDGLSYADIAGYLGVTEATVLGRLHRGRAQLKKELLVMVKDTFKKERLPEDFAAQIRQLLETAAAHGDERQRTIRQMVELGSPAVNPLCEAMGDPRPAIRRLAAAALCRIGDARAAGPIFRALYAGDYWLYNTAFRGGAILRIPGARDELLKILKEGKSSDQYWAIQALVHAKDDEAAVDALREVFRRHGEPKMRACAMWALCELQPQEGVQWVMAGLRDAEIRRLSGHAWWVSLKNGYILPIDVCLRGLEADVAPSGRRIAGWMTLRHGPEGVAALERLMHGDSPDLRAAAAVALASQGHPEAFDILVQELLTGRRERKWARIVADQLLHSYAARLIAWAQAQKPDLERSHELAWAVARARLAAGSASGPELSRFGPPTIQADMLRRLVAAQGAEALPELRRCLAEGKPKKLAREAFWRMCKLGPAFEPAALEMLTSELWTERKAAVCLLRQWGKLTGEQKALAQKDAHLAVRHAADWHPAYTKAAKDGHPKLSRKLGKSGE